MKYIIECYKGRDKQFYWRLVAGSRTIADGAEGYKRRATMIRQIKKLQNSLAGAEIKLLEPVTWTIKR